MFMFFVFFISHYNNKAEFWLSGIKVMQSEK